MIKTKNRNHYDIIYECLKHCRDHEKSITFPTTRSRFMTIFAGNTKVFRQIFVDTMMKNNLIEVNKDVDHHTDVYKITHKGSEYIVYYEMMRKLLGYDV
jgi:predicted transcriptional regulator